MASTPGSLWIMQHTKTDLPMNSQSGGAEESLLVMTIYAAEAEAAFLKMTSHQTTPNSYVEFVHVQYT